jgi:hypothetical protein
VVEPVPRKSIAELVLLSFQNMTDGSHTFNRTAPEMREGNLYVMEKKDVTTSDAEYDAHGQRSILGKVWE